MPIRPDECNELSDSKGYEIICRQIDNSLKMGKRVFDIQSQFDTKEIIDRIINDYSLYWSIRWYPTNTVKTKIGTYSIHVTKVLHFTPLEQVRPPSRLRPK